MTRHLADHEQPKQEEGLARFLRIARAESDSFWKALWKRRSMPGAGNRRVVEYVRIERGRKG